MSDDQQTEVKAPLLPGDVVFFQACKRMPHRKAGVVAFKGHAFGLMLGIVPPFAKAPPEDHLLRLLGGIGFISLDDIGEMLGHEALATIQDKFKHKYYTLVNAEPPEEPNENAVEPTPLPVREPSPSLIFDAKGNPL